MDDTKNDKDAQRAAGKGNGWSSLPTGPQQPGWPLHSCVPPKAAAPDAVIQTRVSRIRGRIKAALAGRASPPSAVFPPQPPGPATGSARSGTGHDGPGSPKA